MSWKKDDGQLALRAEIVSELVADGSLAHFAGQQATAELVKINREGPKEHTVHAGNTVFIVTAKE